MGQLDSKYLPDVNPRVEGSGNAPKSWREIVSGDPSVTSREDIINPYAVVNPRDYALTRKGRMQYESDLARVIEFQKQQIASYEEWYNSPEQAANREHAAGLNPDLIGLENAGAAAEVPSADSLPGQNLPTNGELFTNVLGSVSSFISALNSVGSIASAFASIPNFIKTGENLDLQNMSLLRDLVTSDIGSLLGTALNENPDLDLDQWFSQDENFQTLRSSYGSSPHFESILSTQRRNLLAHHKSAVELQKDNASNLWDYASIASNPYWSPYQKVLVSQLAPYMKTLNDMEVSQMKFTTLLNDIKSEYVNGLDVSTAIDVANSKFGYDSSYWSNISGKLMASYDQFVKGYDVSLSNMRNQIYENLFQTWNSNPGSPDGLTASYFILGQMPTHFITHGTAMYAQMFTRMRESIKNFFTELGISTDGFSLESTHEEFSRWMQQKIDERMNSMIELGID